jgi:hypothetical protein
MLAILMSPAFIGNHSTGREQFTKVKVDEWLSLVFCPDQFIYKEIQLTF